MDQLGEQVTELIHQPTPIQHGPSVLTDELVSGMSNKLDQICAQETILCLDSQMNQLREQVTELLHRPQPVQSGPSAVTDELVANISNKLDQICAREPVISIELESLKLSVDALEKTTAATAAAAVTVASSRTDASQMQDRPLQSLQLESPLVASSKHKQKPVAHFGDDFITEDFETRLITFFESKSDQFITEGDRSTLSFGEQYKYSGSRSSSSDRTIPQAIAPLIEKINSELCTDENTRVNSCLINRFQGALSSLPVHSDDEPTIHPESSIVTVSVGQGCTIRFVNSNDEHVYSQEVTPRSVYSMTRRSQEFFKHCIDPGSIAEGVRYSLTFRSVSGLNRNATCIIGDSNTQGLKFGTDHRKTFGKSLPGKQFFAPTVNDIDPYVSCGYSNVVIMCGINDIKQDHVNNQTDLHNIFKSYVSKIDQIQSVNRNCHIFLVPILPTKRSDLNRKAICFNKFIIDELLSSNFGVTLVRGIDDFLDESGLLNREISRDLTRFRKPDFLHLNWKGLARLGCLIRDTVIRRKTGGVDRRRRTREVDGTSYRDIAAGGEEQRDGYQPS